VPSGLRIGLLVRAFVLSKTRQGQTTSPVKSWDGRETLTSEPSDDLSKAAIEASASIFITLVELSRRTASTAQVRLQWIMGQRNSIGNTKTEKQQES